MSDDISRIHELLDLIEKLRTVREHAEIKTFEEYTGYEDVGHQIGAALRELKRLCEQIAEDQLSDDEKRQVEAALNNDRDIADIRTRRLKFGSNWAIRLAKSDQRPMKLPRRHRRNDLEM